MIRHCFPQRPKKPYLCAMLYAVYSLYTFSMFWASVHFYNKILKVQDILSMNSSTMLVCRTSAFLWNSLLYETSFFALLFTFSYTRTAETTYCLCSYILLSTKLKSNAAWEEDEYDFSTQLLFQLNALVFIKSTRYCNLYFLSLYS
jgi:hypothetical protein